MNTPEPCNNTETDNFLKIFLNNALADIMGLLKAECGSLFLFDPKNNDLVLDSFLNSKDLQIKGLRKRLGEGISGKVVELKIPVLVNDINGDIRFTRNGFNHYNTGSFISIPLFGSTGLLGLMNIADKQSREPFSQKDMETAVLLARYSCISAEHLLQSSKLKDEKEILNKQKSLLEKYASVGKLAAGVVHEINNPLDGIIRYTNMLLNQTEGNSVSGEYLLEVKNGLNRIANITKSLLEFSHQVNSNNHHRVKNYVGIPELIDESLCLFKERIKNNITVNKKYQEPLPKILDMGLQHVFMNLIKNSLDAIAPEGGALDITVGIKGAEIEIIFRDSGSGISSEVMEHIFEPFFTTKTCNKGTGLGLAICNEIINKYEGKIEVKDSTPKGAAFVILIPEKHLENA
ncbi:MAG: ATP-binding protein [Candidatus Omnitrophota bacterium]